MSDALSVLHVFKTYLPDSFTGIERVIHGIACGTAPLGVASTVLSLSADPEANSVDIDGHRAEKAKLDYDFASTPISASFFPRFRELAADADLVHYHFPWPLADLAHLITRHGKPAIATYHADIVRQRAIAPFYGPLMHAFLSRMDRLVATSPTYLESSPVLVRYRDRTEIIPIGFDRSDFPDPGEARRAHWLKRFPDGFFVFVGVMRYYKGLGTLMAAAELTGLPVVLVGSGEREAELHRLARDRGLTNVVFLGPLDERHKTALIETCTALVLPSDRRSEGFGIVLVEAAMNARPMITAEIGTGTSYVNENGITGMVVPPRDPQALATAMRRLWDDRALAERMGAAAAERHRRLFTGKKMAGSYARLYRRILAARELHSVESPAR